MGEVRKVNVIYFLSRMGNVEHPHLLRVQNLSRNRVFLRDVKKWLADLRGNEMPEAFSWSYKRRYKNGYIWQDLMDNDLITPISDNEYVLKGSEILKSPCTWEQRNGDSDEQRRSYSQKSLLIDSSRKSISGIYRESPVFGSEQSTTTDESAINEVETINLNLAKNRKRFEKLLFQSSPKSNSDRPQRNKMEIGSEENNGRPSVSSSSSKSSIHSMRSRSYSSTGASQMFRNLITCGGLDSNDAVLIPLKQYHGDKIKIGGSSSARVSRNSREDEHQQATRKSFDAAWINSKEKTQFPKPKTVSSATKPSLAPSCSQCGKSFNPEKLHSHMKSCSGMKKALAKCVDKTTPLKQQRHPLPV